MECMNLCKYFCNFVRFFFAILVLCFVSNFGNVNEKTVKKDFFEYNNFVFIILLILFVQYFLICFSLECLNLGQWIRAARAAFQSVHSFFSSLGHRNCRYFTGFKIIRIDVRKKFVFKSLFACHSFQWIVQKVKIILR